MAELLFINANQVVTCAGPARARRGSEMRQLEVLQGAAVLVSGPTISEVAPQSLLMASHSSARVVDCSGCILTPGLVDSHTHAVFGANRAAEQEMRAAGAAYMEIASRGGGIHSSVRDLRARSTEELLALALPRIRRMMSYGTTTVEVKSGYGLSLVDELRTLRVIEQLGAILPLRVIPTWLGAHEIPLEFRDRAGGREQYIETLLNDQLPAVAAERLANFADVFCEPGVFTPDETRLILSAAAQHGLRPKLHADELHGSGGAELAVTLGAVSADHLAAISPSGIEAIAASGVVATLLPGTMLFLGRDSRAPARAIIDGGGAVALATDFNPGTSPTVNLPLIATLGSSVLRMSAAECLLAITVNGAAALGLAHRTGQISRGFDADLALFEGTDFRELPYWYGDRLCRGSWSQGKACHQFELPIIS